MYNMANHLILGMQMNKKLQQLKAPKKKNLQASKLSVEGRGMVKYL
jgi:transcription factor SPN1